MSRNKCDYLVVIRENEDEYPEDRDTKVINGTFEYETGNFASITDELPMRVGIDMGVKLKELIG